jgi:hypothetical protein
LVLKNTLWKAADEPKAYTTEDYLRITEEQANALVSEEQRKGIFIPYHNKFLFICCFIESLYCHRSHGWLMLGALDYQHHSSVIFACSKYLQQLLKPAKTLYLKHSLFGF